MSDRPPRRPRRVQLSTPGSSEKMIQKASESKADHVFLDLEDAVAPSQKRDARKKIVQGELKIDFPIHRENPFKRKAVNEFEPPAKAEDA